MQQEWIADIEGKLAKLDQKQNHFVSPTVEQIYGTYVGTNTQSQIGVTAGQGPERDEILLTFQQSGSGVTGTYQTSRGGRGKGAGHQGQRRQAFEARVLRPPPRKTRYEKWATETESRNDAFVPRSGIRRLNPTRRIGPIRGILDVRRKPVVETGLAGWGGRTLTSEFGDARERRTKL